MTEFTTTSENKSRMRPVAGLTPYAGPWGKDQVARLLKHAMFGATKADVDYFSAKTLSETVATLLTVPAAAPAPPLNNYSTGADPKNTDPNVPLGKTWVSVADNNFNAQRISSYKAWWIGLMATQTRSFQEKMVLFWHNHFATETNNNPARYAYVHNVTLRRNALGNFRTLAKEISVDPLMLRFLNGYKNVKGVAPDENYARELQELFTVGKNADGTTLYTESDVQAAARVLTGYTIDDKNVKGVFVLDRHDTTNKQFSAFYGNKLIKGLTPDKTAASIAAATVAGAAELDQMLDMIFAAKSPASASNTTVAAYLVRKIYRFFVYYNIDATVEANVIQPLATIFTNSKFEIKPVLQALFTSQHFFDAGLKGSLIKSPTESVVGTVREFNVAFPGATDYLSQYAMWNQLVYQASNQGQNIGDPLNVAGWAPYYQVPLYHELWINTDTLPLRYTFGDTLIGAGYAAAPYHMVIDPIAFTKMFSSAADPTQLVNDLLAFLYQLPVLPDVVAVMKATLVGTVADHYWTDLWNQYLAKPEDAATIKLVKSKLSALYKHLLDQPEYQLA